MEDDLSTVIKQYGLAVLNTANEGEGKKRLPVVQATRGF